MKTARAKGGLSTSVPFEPNSNSSILLAHQERRHSDGPQPWSQFHREERCEACLGRCVPEREKHDRFPSIKGGTQTRRVCCYLKKKSHRHLPHQMTTTTACSWTHPNSKPCTE